MKSVTTEHQYHQLNYAEPATVQHTPNEVMAAVQMHAKQGEDLVLATRRIIYEWKFEKRMAYIYFIIGFAIGALLL